MYEETITPKGSSRSDLIGLAVLVVLFIVSLVLGGTLAHAGNTVVVLCVRLVLFLMLVLFCVFFYLKRIRGFRYSLFLTPGEHETAGEYPAGTFVIESLVGDSPSLIMLADAGQVSYRLYVPGERPMGLRVARATNVPSDEAYTLVVEGVRREQAYAFSPSDELVKMLKAAIAHEPIHAPFAAENDAEPDERFPEVDDA